MTVGCLNVNPFIGQADHGPEIWTYGQRNPQGLRRAGTDRGSKTRSFETGSKKYSLGLSRH